jgi:hypothetical protein
MTGCKSPTLPPRVLSFDISYGSGLISDFIVIVRSSQT